ncbi:hypothetical protein EPN42_05665 [bacterium]|nr:MAG: hypothetical protein EPN42_05665 [bacterium]
MSVAVSDVRFQIQDQPRSFGVAPESPRVIGTADGVTMIFFLPLDRWQYVAGSAQLYATPSGGSTIGIASSAYAISQQGQVVFTTAPGASGSPIASGSAIAASFQGTAFANADLANVLTRNQAKYSDDNSVLKGCTLDMINVLLMDYERLSMTRQVEWERNPAYVVRTLQRLKADLREELEGGPRPGAAIPALLFGGVSLRPYTPQR